MSYIKLNETNIYIKEMNSNEEMISWSTILITTFVTAITAIIVCLVNARFHRRHQIHEYEHHDGIVEFLQEEIELEYAIRLANQLDIFTEDEDEDDGDDFPIENL
ncbi:PREDICTED: uncharacterized protein LOC108566729 [Nicrophorus vespilloides]|uniref:Uncharacterized protein LOC108566729 n=1 Tax=Nicrophorus vespilloides TaxID=110193 RepID=A0ABM1N5Y3_NICVS|nr:PREDICTED: uncharacterized protein LOC108566729 [Nicrophorus vespilloides]